MEIIYPTKKAFKRTARKAAKAAKRLNPMRFNRG